MRINYNISSIIARNALNNNDNRLAASIERLSSGLKINSAADDSAGLAISIKMDAQIKSLERADQNAADGISITNTVDGAMSEMQEILQRMNELAIQAANGTYADSDRAQIQGEIDQLIQELDRISETTEFNAQNLLDGTFALKGYTNSENIKVLSYGDGVTSGTYVINKIVYNHYEDKIEKYDSYIEHNADAEIKHKDYFEAESAEDIKKALQTNDVAGYQAFPDGTRVLLDHENITLKAENDFEIKLTVNDRINNLGYAATSTTVSYITTNNYQNVTIETANGSAKYNISNLNVIESVVRDAAGQVVSTTISYNTGTVQEGLTGLNSDLNKAFLTEFPDGVSFEISNFEVDSTAYTQKTYTENGITTQYNMHQTKITMDVMSTDVTGATQSKTLTYYVSIPISNEYNEMINKKRAQNPALSYEEVYDVMYPKFEAGLPDGVKDNPMNKYLYTHTETTKTEFTIGSTQDPIYINATGVGSMRLQVGANEGQVIAIEIPNMSAYNLGVDKIDLGTEESATNAIDAIGNAINNMSSIRAKIGAYTNRIEHTITNLDTTIENMTAAYSRIMDVDMATEMTEYSTVQVLVQSATAMLAQANEKPQTALQLLQ